MRKLKLFFACLLMAVLSIGQMWGAISTNSTWTATALADIPDGSTVIILNARGMAISNATVTKAPAKVEASYSTTTKKISVTTSGKSLDDIAWTTQNGTNGTKFWVYGSTTNLLGLTKLNDNNAVAVNVTSTAVYSEFVMGANGNLLEAMNGANRGGRFVGEYVSGSDWRSYNSEAANNYKSGSTVPALTFYVLDAGDPPAPTVCETPTFDPEGGEFSTNSIDVEITTTTDDATIYYTLDGSEPTSASTLYEGAIEITATTTIKAIAVKDGLTDSDVATAIYTKVEPFAGSILEITKTDFTTVSYDDNAGDHEKDGVTFTTAKVYQSGSSIQFQKTNGLLYNKTDLGEISKIEITTYTGKANNLVVYSGTTENPTSGAVTGSTSGSVTTYTFASGNGYFAIKCNGTGASNVDPIKIYYTGTVTVKQDAGLAYAEADQKNLIKFGAAFTAPTLSTADGFNGIVTYASSNTEVAEVAANGAVTIKTVGVAEITASFAGNDDFKAGSASYTIGVTNHAGTEVDPYVAADVKIVIDAVETLENAYATGIVSSIYSTSLPTEGYISFYFSADGNTTGQQIEAYKCYGLDSAPFEALTDVKTGATVVVTGTLKKFNSTYEFDQNCHLVSYEAPEVPKTHIANDQANPYTVAQAIAYAADGVTYDLDDYVYVQGVVYDVKSFNEGVMNIFIKDANAENQFELYKCAGINDGNATTPFEALTDVQAGNIVIGYGQLTVFNTTYEFKQGNYLVDLQTPATGVQLDATAEVEAGSTVNLTATILPSNATGTIVWSVESGDDYASVENGVVTGIAEGEAVIRATVQGTEIFAECTVTVNAAVDPGTYDYALVTDVAQLQDGLKVIIVAANEDKAAGSAAATYRNVVDVERTTGGNYLILDTENMPTEFTLGVPAAGQYTFNDGDGYMYESAAKSVKVQTDPFNWSITIGDGNIATIQATNELRYNSSSPRFTTYASGQQALQLYVKDDGKQPAGLAWSTDAVELTVGDEFTAPTLTNTHELTVTIASNNPELATVEGGVVSLVENATGTAIITASYAGDDTYRAASVSYTITVNAATPTPAETKNVVILAEYNSKFYAMTNSLTSGALAGVEVEKDGSKIVVSSAEDKAAIQWTATVDGDNTTLKDGDDYYIKGSSGASLSLEADPYNWNWDGEKSCYISSAYTNRGLFFSNSGNVFKGYALSNITSDGYAATEVIEIDPEDIVISSKVDPALAYDPTSDEITVGDAWSAPVLGYATGFDGLAVIEYGSNNESVATVTEGGEISLAGGYGTAVITATFGGNTNYLAGSATYTITVNAPAPTPTGTIYRKVTATEDITDGEYLIVYEGDATHDAAVFDGSLDNDNIDVAKKVLPVAIVNNEIAGNTELDAAVFTIDVTAGSLQSASGYYIGKADYANGMDKSTTEAYVNTFAITDGEAVIKGAGNCTLRYNYASDQLRFRYYKSGQQAIQLYKKETATPVDPTPDYTRTVEINRYGTICLPNGGTIEGAKLYDIDYYDGTSTLYLLEVNGNAMEAGKPYIFLPSATSLEVFYTDDADEDAGTYRGLVGSYSKQNVNEIAGENYILYQNAYYLVNSTAYVDVNRAYIHMESVPTTPYQQQGAPRRRVAMNVYSEQVATGIGELNASETPVKMIIDGQLFIIRGEKMYDATGRLVK